MYEDKKSKHKLQTHLKIKFKQKESETAQMVAQNLRYLQEKKIDNFGIKFSDFKTRYNN